MDSWWWSSWWVIIAASNCHDFMMKGMVWTLKVMVWWHFVHDSEHKVKSSCSLILVMFGLVLLQLTQWVSSTKCVWWSKKISWWYWFSLMTLSKIQQFLESLKRKTGLTALSGFNVQEDHLWHLPPRWQTLHNFWELKFSRMSIWCRRIHNELGSVGDEWTVSPSFHNLCHIGMFLQRMDLMVIMCCDKCEEKVKEEIQELDGKLTACSRNPCSQICK